MTANDNDATQIEHHHRHVTTEWKREEVGMVGKDGRGERMRGEGEGHDDDDLLVVLPRMFCRQQGGWRGGPGHNDVPCHCPLQSSMTTRGQDGMYVPPGSFPLPFLWCRRQGPA